MPGPIAVQSVPLANTLEDIYTAGATVTVAGFWVCNRGDDEARVRIEYAPLGASSAPSHSLAHDMKVLPHDQVAIAIVFKASASDVVRVRSDTGNVAFHLILDS